MNRMIRFIVNEIEVMVFGKILKRTRVALASKLDKKDHDDFIKEIVLAMKQPEDKRSIFEVKSDMLSVERKYNVKHIWSKSY